MTEIKNNFSSEFVECLKVVECLERHCFKICGVYENGIDEYFIEMLFDSPIGEEFLVSFHFDGTEQSFLDQLRESWKWFDLETYEMLCTEWWREYWDRNALVRDFDSINEAFEKTCLDLEHVIHEQKKAKKRRV